MPSATANQSPHSCYMGGLGLWYKFINSLWPQSSAPLLNGWVFELTEGRGKERSMVSEEKSDAQRMQYPQELTQNVHGYKRSLDMDCKFVFSSFQWSNSSNPLLSPALYDNRSTAATRQLLQARLQVPHPVSIFGAILQETCHVNRSVEQYVGRYYKVTTCAWPGRLDNFCEKDSRHY